MVAIQDKHNCIKSQMYYFLYEGKRKNISLLTERHQPQPVSHQCWHCVMWLHCDSTGKFASNSTTVSLEIEQIENNGLLTMSETCKDMFARVLLSSTNIRIMEELGEGVVWVTTSLTQIIFSYLFRCILQSKKRYSICWGGWLSKYNRCCCKTSQV